MQCNTAMYTFILFRRLWWQFWSNFRWLWWAHTPCLVWVGFVFNSLLFSERAVLTAGTLACVASVSILFRRKERQRNGFLGFLAAREMTSPLTRAIFRAVFDSRSSFFVPKQHGNACYAGYGYSSGTPFHVILSSNTDMMFKVQFHSWKCCN